MPPPWTSSLERGASAARKRDAAMKLLYGDMRPDTDAYMGSIRIPDRIPGRPDEEGQARTPKDTSCSQSARLLIVVLSISALLLTNRDRFVHYAQHHQAGRRSAGRDPRAWPTAT
jgi:hypothetical protein